MMILVAYSVFDKAAGTYATPFFAVNDDVAKRNFRFSCSKLDNVFIQDLALCEVGSFSIETGWMESPVSSNFRVVDSGEFILAEREIEKKNSEVKQ